MNSKPVEISEAMRKELERIKADAETMVKNISDILSESEEGSISWWDRRNSVLAEVIKRGGTVNKTEWIQIGRKYNIDSRGLGGFFASNGSMVKIGMDRRAVTERGQREVKEWLSSNPEKAEELGLDPAEI